MKIDAHEVYPQLWQGSKPPEGSALAQRGFHALVLCAAEHQPAPQRFAGVKVIHAPNLDDSSRLPTRNELRIAMKAAREVAGLVAEGQKVLTTCWMGHNRSGLVNALAIHLLTGMDGASCVDLIQKRRPMTLRNPAFCHVLSNIEEAP